MTSFDVLYGTTHEKMAQDFQLILYRHPKGEFVQVDNNLEFSKLLILFDCREGTANPCVQLTQHHCIFEEL